MHNEHGRMLDLVLARKPLKGTVSDDILVNFDVHYSSLNAIMDINIDGNIFLSKSDMSFNFRRFNFHALFENMCHIDWASHENCSNVNEACNIQDNQLPLITSLFGISLQQLDGK